jgi:hypothetical protein
VPATIGVILRVEPVVPERVGVEPGVVASVSVKVGPSIGRLLFAVVTAIAPIVRFESSVMVFEPEVVNVAVLPDPLAMVPPVHLDASLHAPVPDAHVPLWARASWGENKQAAATRAKPGDKPIFERRTPHARCRRMPHPSSAFFRSFSS